MIRAQKLLEAAETGSADLLKEMKKIKGSKKVKLDLPDEVAGASGESNIVEKFCEVYEELYNSSGSYDALQGIKEQLEINIVGEESLEEVLKVTGEIVKKAACKMKPGK